MTESTGAGTRAVGITRIAPRTGAVDLGLPELWEGRELVGFLTWRDIKVRYKQTLLGGAWAILQPVLTMIVFTLVFGRVADVDSQGIPYPVFSFAALVPWTLFTYGLQQSSMSLVTNSNLLTKVYFPRLVLPISSQLSGVVDFALAFLVLMILMVVYSVSWSLSLLGVVPLLVFTLIPSLGVGLWLAALNVRYRDIKYTLPFVTQLWLFATPIAYSAAALPQGWRWVLALNPMTAVVVGFRAAVVGTPVGDPWQFLLSFAVGFVFLVSGLWYFRRTERGFADVV